MPSSPPRHTHTTIYAPIPSATFSTRRLWRLAPTHDIIHQQRHRRMAPTRLASRRPSRHHRSAPHKRSPASSRARHDHSQGAHMPPAQSSTRVHTCWPQRAPHGDATRPRCSRRRTCSRFRAAAPALAAAAAAIAAVTSLSDIREGNLTSLPALPVTTGKPEHFVQDRGH